MRPRHFSTKTPSVATSAKSAPFRWRPASRSRPRSTDSSRTTPTTSCSTSASTTTNTLSNDRSQRPSPSPTSSAPPLKPSKLVSFLVPMATTPLPSSGSRTHPIPAPSYDAWTYAVFARERGTCRSAQTASSSTSFWNRGSTAGASAKSTSWTAASSPTADATTSSPDPTCVTSRTTSAPSPQQISSRCRRASSQRNKLRNIDAAIRRLKCAGDLARSGYLRPADGRRACGTRARAYPRNPPNTRSGPT